MVDCDNGPYGSGLELSERTFVWALVLLIAGVPVAVLPGGANACTDASGAPCPITVENNPATAENLISRGEAGRNGVGVGSDGNGNPGGVGRPGAKVTQTTTIAPRKPISRKAVVGSSSIGGNGGNGADIKSSGTTTGGFAGNAGVSSDAILSFEGVIDDDSADESIVVLSGGGIGGKGGKGTTTLLGAATGRLGGTGGSSGNATLTASTQIVKQQSKNATAVAVTTIGGPAGNGGNASTASLTTVEGKASPGGGGTGGASGTAAATLNKLTQAQTPSTGVDINGAITVQSYGGRGGNAGKGEGSTAGVNPERGGTGGPGGVATLTTGPDLHVDVTSGGQSKLRAGALVFSNGGIGGFGTDSESPGSKAGDGGFGGKGGSATLNHSGTITTTGQYLHGGLVQSIGGGGGGGGAINGFLLTQGGFGGTGADGGVTQINLRDQSVIRAEGRGSVGAVAQSLGGGGGAGGDARSVTVGASLALGGFGGNGGNGAGTSVFLNNARVTSIAPGVDTPNSQKQFETIAGGGVMAQSIGGSGGAAGNAFSGGVGTVSLAIGGQGGGGGNGGDALISADSGSLVTTYGDHAVGLDAHSVGGGGGKGGSAISLNVEANGLPSVGVAIGGAGGSGGVGGKASVENAGQVLTYGPNAPGIKAASIGGGGGHGGTALSTVYATTPVPEIPSLAVSVTLGGKGGKGNAGGEVDVHNTGLVWTGGHGAQAVVAQSVGGGGGYGGDSSSTSFAGGPANVKLSVGVTLGGAGGEGGTGGTVNVTNEAFLATFGQDAQAIAAQSVGGGGGIGGGSDVGSVADDADTFSLSPSVSVGGAAGDGNLGGSVLVLNKGPIGTRGDRADGILAQSIGGSGGIGGGGTGSAGAGNLSFSTAVGGKGGTANHGGSVNVQNENTIATSGFQAVGINAQSIGGGGGSGGKGAAVGGGSGKAPPAQDLQKAVEGADGFERIEPGVLKINGFSIGDVDNYDPKQIFDVVKEREEEDEESGSIPSVSLAVSVGGSGGAGGNGGEVFVVNEGQIVTTGAHSDGIVVQSIGGGGGSSGGTTAKATNDNKIGASLAVGGTGGAAGDGGDIEIGTAKNSQITTSGVYAHGIFAHSIGGGGGRSAATVASNDVGLTAGLTIGRGGGASGSGGKVDITHGAGPIQTQGRAAIGIFAQSIGGSGGVAQITSNDGIKRNAIAKIEEKIKLSLTIGANGGGAGEGGEIDIKVMEANANAAPTISTEGRNAHGILAQSFGGSGGTALGGQTSGFEFFRGGNSGQGNEGGPITMDIRSDISTTGRGAYGILVQSIGGGGVLGGDLAGIEVLTAPDGYLLPFTDQPAGDSNSGNGGVVEVTVDGANIRTEELQAPAIFVQSLGGGGGHVATLGDNPDTDQGIRSGSSGAPGAGNKITITVGKSGGSPAQVISRGDDGISAQSDGGQGGSPITVNVGPGSQVVGGGGGVASAIRLRGGALAKGSPNVINNAGTIRPFSRRKDDLALWVDRDTTVVNQGIITGQICGPISGNVQPGNECENSGTGSVASATAATADRAVTVLNEPDGLITMGPRMQLGPKGKLRNRGVLEIGNGIERAVTRVTGDLKHQSTGVLSFDIDTDSGRFDRLIVDGDVELDGAVAVRPVTLGRAELPVLSATGGISRAQDFAVSEPHVFDYNTSISDDTLLLAIDADFQGVEGVRGSNNSLAGHLQDIWDSEAGGFGTAFVDLSTVEDADGWSDTLDVLSGRAISAVAAARLESSTRLVDSVFSCPVFVGDSALLSERSCAWVRVEAAHFDRNASGDNIDYDGNATTTLVGGQREIAPGWFLGGVIGYEQSRLNSDLGATDVDGDAGLAVAALKYQRGALTLSGAVDLGYGSFDSDRTIALAGDVRTASASSDALNAGLHLRAAYQAVRGNWYVQPSVDFDATYLRLDGYEESGAGAFDLDVDTSDQTVLTLTPAARIGRRIQLESGALLNAYAEGAISFNDGNDWKSTARFANAPASARDFTAELDTPDTIGRVNLGIEVFETGRLNLQAEYQADFADNYLAQSGQLRLSWLF